MKKIVNYFFSLYSKYNEIIKYLIAGILTTIVSLFSYYITVLTVLNPNNAIELQIANIFSWICSRTFAYFINRSYVFKSKNKNKTKEAFSFYTSRITTLFIDMFIMFLFVTIFHINDKISKLIVQVVITILNYILSKIFVFKKKN